MINFHVLWFKRRVMQHVLQPMSCGVVQPTGSPAGCRWIVVPRVLKSRMGARAFSYQFNSIQFICIAQFHKLQICLGVLYNLYT